jgi:hypothetical protein
VDAAIMFIMKQRDETSDPAIEANANRTLATLRRFR